jgi:hypothetical protein
MEEDLKIYKKINKSGFKTKIEHIYYNLDQQVVEITICEERKEDVFIVDEERFIKENRLIKNLAKKELTKLEKKIKNNRMVIAISEGNLQETEKANKHLNKNKKRLEKFKSFIDGQ